MTDLVQAWRHVLDKLGTAAKALQRDPSSIRLLAVSKTFPLADIQTLFAAGQHAFGENYAKELQEKATVLPQAEWHFIGPLQSNKTRIVAKYADWVHSVDRPSILQRLSIQRPAYLPDLNICLAVNVRDAISKNGVLPEALRCLAETALQYHNLRLRGLMCIAEATSDALKLRAQFFTLYRLFDELNQTGFALDTLSMGMTNDLDIAIAAGANMVRVGTAIFGARKVKS